MEAKKYLLKKGIQNIVVFAENLDEENKDRLELSTLLEAYAEQRSEAVSAVETLVMPPEILDLVRWLAETTMDWHIRRHKALSFEGEECRNYLAMHFPIIQGTMNQVNLEKIGEQEYDIKKVGKAVKWLLEKGHNIRFSEPSKTRSQSHKPVNGSDNRFR